MFGGRRGPQLVGVLAPVPEPHAAIIQRWRHELGDKTADIVPPHVTLLGFRAMNRVCGVCFDPADPASAPAGFYEIARGAR